ncbi:MAG: hypothetical protein ACE5PT_03020 [Gemmatimonadales bacterium]
MRRFNLRHTAHGARRTAYSVLSPALLFAASLASLSCSDAADFALPRPENFYYRLEVSGIPTEPAGVLLLWDHVNHPDLQVYRVYSRLAVTDAFALRGSTTSNTFHDRGLPELEYFVVAVDIEGREGEPSEVVQIDERLRLEAPAWIASTSLNGAIYLAWADNAYQTAPEGFEQYHVYSATFSLDDPVCRDWAREGTTVAPEFLVGALPNGYPRCFAVSAESIEGFESLWSPERVDTPRPDARNVVVAALDVDQLMSGFRFFQDLNGDNLVGLDELGIVRDGTRSDIDFRVERDTTTGDFFLVPVRSGTEIALYDTAPVEDLTAIDVAPDTGYSTAAIQAVPQYGYVFRMSGGDQFARFGAIRVTHVGREYMVFDWSYQTDPDNPELSVGAGLKAQGGWGKTTRH